MALQIRLQDVLTGRQSNSPTIPLHPYNTDPAE